MLVTLGFAMSMLGEHAVVLGASMSGLLAARVLADHFKRSRSSTATNCPMNPSIGAEFPKVGTCGDAVCSLNPI